MLLMLKVQISLEPKISCIADPKIADPKISCIADPSLTSRIAESKLSREILSAFLSKLNFWRFSAFFLPFLSKFKISHFTFCRSEDFLLVKFPSASEAKSLKYGSCPSFRGTPPLENSCLIYFPSVFSSFKWH